MVASLGGHCFGHRYNAAGDGCFLRDIAANSLDAAAVLWSGVLDRLFHQRHRHGTLAPQMFYCDGIGTGTMSVCGRGFAILDRWRRWPGPGVGLVWDVAEAMSLQDFV